MLPSPPEETSAQHFYDSHRPALHVDLPAFFRPVPSGFAPEDVEFLRLKRCFSVPSLPLQNALLQAFAEYIHPQLPVLEFHTFLKIVQNQDNSEGCVSLLQYQAVMFAAAAFVDVQYLLQEEYSSRKEAQALLFQRARWLYDLEYESDRLTLVQVLLLMSYWNGGDDNHRESWHWTGAAISVALTIDLHLDPNEPNMAISERKLRRRVWWSCFMRERVLSLESRRPTHIRLEDSDVPMLELRDFEIRALPESITLISRDCKAVWDVSTQRTLAAICVARIRLCVCISRMQEAQQNSLRSLRLSLQDAARPASPGDLVGHDEALHRVDEELLAWTESLPRSCQFRTLSEADCQSGQTAVAVQRTLLYLLYQTTVSILHRGRIVMSASSKMHCPRQIQHMSRWRVREATMHITRVASELHQLHLDVFLPSTGIPIFLTAATVHIMEMRSWRPERRQIAVQGFSQCMQVLTNLSELYPAAKESIRVIRSTMAERISQT